MLVTIQFRRGTSSQWASVDPILGQAEPGYDSTVGGIKIGDGVSRWSELPWEGGGGGGGPVTYADLPDGSTITLYFTEEGGWPDRPFERPNLSVNWVDPIGTGGVPPTAIPWLDLVIANASED